MFRRFREHDYRSVTELSGFWDFAFLGDVDPDEVDVGEIEFNDRMAVPGCFDATPAYVGLRGLAAYRAHVVLRDDTPHRLIFDGVHHWCRVFVGRKAHRDHVGGFTRFPVEIVGHPPGETEIVVLVDNRLDYERCPLHLDYVDWYHHGGIARTVQLQRLGKLWIDGVKAITVDTQQPTIEVSIDFGALKPPGYTRMLVTCDEKVVVEEEINLIESTGRIQRTVELPGARLWSPEEPNLHLLHIRLGEDDLRERIGIRKISVNQQQILINNKPIRLLGFNRHETHPQFGHALPNAILTADVQLLRDLGCNFVRGSHYPQDLRFLDLCDEAGICVWNEAIGWHNNAEQLNDAHFIDAMETHIDEMVAMSQNRPSVIMWGVLNEGFSDDPRCRPGYAVLLERVRRLDPTRPVTYACNRPLTDVCLDLVDIVAINRYPGWYHCEIEDLPGFIDEHMAHLDATGQAHKPIIVSEIGGGAIRGWRDAYQDRWSEQYQAELLDKIIRHLFVDRQRVCGLSIWQFCDCRTSESSEDILGRPRAYNNKGVVDEYRRPKMAYDVVKRLYHALNEQENAANG